MRRASKHSCVMRACGAGRGRNWALFQWTVTEGLRRFDIDMGGPQRTLADPPQLLRHLKATPTAGIYILLDFHPYLTDPLNVRTLKDIAQSYDQVARTVVLMSHEVVIPEELEHLTARLKLAPPTSNERLMIITRVAHEWSAAHAGHSVHIDPDVLERLVENLGGLDAADTEHVARQVLNEHGAVAMADLTAVFAAKYQLLNRGGTLTYEPANA